MQLSIRLNAVKNMVTPGYTLADVGTDHGYIPIALVEQGTCPCALAMDINEGPLIRAKEHIKEHGLSDQIETRLSDGLHQYQAGDTEAILIAGMGGPLMLKILSENQEASRGAKELILSPHSEWELVRRTLLEDGFSILQEDMVFEEGKYYVILKAVYEGKKVSDWTKMDYRYGQYLLEGEHPILHQYLLEEQGKLLQLQANLRKQETEGAKARLEELEYEIATVDAALRRYRV